MNIVLWEDWQFCSMSDLVIPLAARLTKDVDLAVDRADLPRIAEAVRSLGLEYRHVAGVDMLVDAKAPKARSGVHLLFAGEKVRPSDLEPVPGFSEPTVERRRDFVGVARRTGAHEADQFSAER